MRLRELFNSLAAALVTTAAILAVAWPGPVDAVGNSGSQLQPLVPSPAQKTDPPRETTLDALGCRFTLAMDKNNFGPGESPILALSATNLTDRPVQAKLRLQILASRRPSPMARVLPTPQAVWSQECVVDLQPREAKSRTIAAKAELAADAVVTFTMSAGG